MIAYRHADPRFPFLWEIADQPSARWHVRGDGPTQYFADTPTGAWAEFLRHEELTEPEDLQSVRRALWVIELPTLPRSRPRLPATVLRGDAASYPRCQQAAQRLRRRGATGLVAPSAALKPGAAAGWRVNGGLQPGPTRNGRVIVLFGRWPSLVGWQVAAHAAPAAELLQRVRPLGATDESGPTASDVT